MAQLSTLGSIMRILIFKILRFLGIPLGILLLLPGEPHKHMTPHYLWSGLVCCVGFLTCVPFSRLRSTALFWPVLTLYAALAFIFGVTAVWNIVASLFGGDFKGLGIVDTLGLVLTMLGMISLLAIQIPCILILRRRNYA